MHAAYDIESLDKVGRIYLPDIGDHLATAATKAGAVDDGAAMFAGLTPGFGGVGDVAYWVAARSTLRNLLEQAEERVADAGTAIRGIARRYDEAERRAIELMPTEWFDSNAYPRGG